MNVTLRLAELARLHPDSVAIIAPSGRTHAQWTWKQLDDACAELAAGFSSVGVRRGMHVALMVPPSFDFFAITFALFRLGAVPILIDPGMGIRNLGRCLAEAEPVAFVGTSKAHLARRILGWAKPTLKIRIRTGRFGAEHSTEALARAFRGRGQNGFAPTQGEDTAAILFTSGSTGIAKGVVYTHRIFVEQVRMLKEAFGIQDGEIDLATFPLFALFGPALGMTAVIPEMNPTRPAKVDPTKIIGAIERFGVTNMFGSPALIARVGAYGAERGVRLPTLRRVTSAGAPVAARAIETFSRMLAEDVEIFTPYGATESLPVALIGSKEILGETRFLTDAGKGICVGAPLPGIDLRIVRISDEAIPEWSEALELPVGEIGEITVTGPVVTATYFHRDEATKLAKIRHGDAVRHRMGDLGYIDGRGRLWFCGRKSHRVVLADRTLFTIPCEGVFNAHPLVYRSALVGIRKPDGEMIPAICFETHPGKRVRWPDPQGDLAKIAARFDHTRGSPRSYGIAPRSRSISGTTPRSSGNGSRCGRPVSWAIDRVQWFCCCCPDRASSRSRISVSSCSDFVGSGGASALAFTINPSTLTAKKLTMMWLLRKVMMILKKT